MTSNYNITVGLEPSRHFLSAKVQLTWIVNETTEKLEFFLHRNLNIDQITGDGVTGYFNKPGAYAFSPEAVTWVVELSRMVEKGSTIVLEFSYCGCLPEPIPQAWQVNRLSPQWVELGLYGPWFPWNPEAGSFTYSVKAEIEAGFTMVGLGETIRQGQYWLVSSAGAMEDIVLTACKTFDCHSSSTETANLDVWYTEAEDLDCAQAIGSDGIWALEFFREWLGETSSKSDLAVVIARRELGGGYTRPGMVVLSAIDEESRRHKSFIGALAHELAHFWWHAAPTDTWEDWLNEAFAEFSAIKAVAAKDGEARLARILSLKREGLEGLPPIRGLNRRHAQAYQVLYDKGTVLLQDLEDIIGKEKMTTLLRARVAQGINTTEEFLSLLAEVAGSEASLIFSQWLDR